MRNGGEAVAAGYKRRVDELAVRNVKNAYRETNLIVQTVLDWFVDVWCSSQV